jgi:hypothetical protein
MTLRLNPNLTLAVLGAIGIGTAVTFTAPQQLGTAFAFGGGLIGGAGIARDRHRKSQVNKDNAQRVTGIFSALYESNRGLVDPLQLALIADIPATQAHGFLTGLAENIGGQKIPHKNGNGVLFSFPHTSNALDELTANAQNWAQAQVQQMAAELEGQRRALQLAQLQNAAKAATPAPQQDPWTQTGQMPGQL